MEAFELGQSWEAYLTSMQRNRSLMEHQIQKCQLPPIERQRWAQASHVAFVLVFTEDDCQDSISSLPPLLAITHVAPFDMRVLRRSSHLALQRLLSQTEYPPVPMFFFFDAAWQELGRFVEMPRGFRALKSDPEEAFWLRDPDIYDAIWWEMEFAELAHMIGDRSS